MSKAVVLYVFCYADNTVAQTKKAPDTTDYGLASEGRLTLFKIQHNQCTEWYPTAEKWVLIPTVDEVTDCDT
jgi:hypothetical protein